MGIEDINRILRMEDLVKVTMQSLRTGVTDGELLRGVQFKGSVEQRNPLLCVRSQVQYAS